MNFKQSYSWGLVMSFKMVNRQASRTQVPTGEARFREIENLKKGNVPALSVPQNLAQEMVKGIFLADPPTRKIFCNDNAIIYISPWSQA